MLPNNTGLATPLSMFARFNPGCANTFNSSPTGEYCKSNCQRLSALGLYVTSLIQTSVTVTAPPNAGVNVTTVFGVVNTGVPTVVYSTGLF